MMEMTQAALGLMGAFGWQRPAEAELPCRVDLLDAGGLRAIPPAAWDRLAQAALEDNPWLDRQMVLAGLDALGDAGGLKAFALYRRGDGDLVGLFPYRVLGAGFAGIGRSALKLYQVGGAPLLARHDAQAAMISLLGLMAGRNGMARHWVLRHVAPSGAFMSLAQALAGPMGLAVGYAATYERPILSRGGRDLAAHVDEVIGRKRSRDIERNLRRLAEKGAVDFERVTDPVRVAERVEAFLEIEARGWKGKRGTAFLKRSGHADFARRAFAGLGAGAGLASVDSLLLDGVPIAVSINIGRGDTLHTAKCAFDERYRRYGPGMILEYKVIERFFDDPGLSEMDAATTAEGHAITGLWGRTRTVGMAVIGPAGPTTQALRAGIDAAAAGKKMLKRLLSRG